MRQIKAWFGWHERARSGPAARALDGSRAIGCQKSCPLCQKANKANVLSPRPLARRPLAANCCAVDRGGPESCNAPTGGVLEGVCLRLDLGEQRGIARSRRLAPLGLTLFERNIPSEDKTLVPAVPSRNPELLARAPSREPAGRPSAHIRGFDVSDTAATLRSRSRLRPIGADMSGNDSPPSASMTGLRAQCLPGSTLAN